MISNRKVSLKQTSEDHQAGTGEPTILSGGTGDPNQQDPKQLGNGDDPKKGAASSGLTTKPKRTPPVAKYTGFYGLSDMIEAERFARWRSLLAMEDFMVAALMKRLMYEGETVTNRAAYNALRDAMGYFISEIKAGGNLTLATEIDRRYAEVGDGSGDDKDKMPPAPNP